MSVVGKLIADFSSFQEATDKAVVQMKTMSSGAATVEKQLSRMVDGLSGRTLVRDATLAAEAVDRIGGTSKLTETELKRVGAQAQEAINKLKALGEEVPPKLQALSNAVPKPSLFSKVTDSLGPLGAAMAGAFTVTAVVGAGKRVLDFADQLENMSAKTGISTTGLQKFDLAFQSSGVSMDTVSANVTKLAKNVLEGDKGAVGALNKLGISADSLKRMMPEDQFTKVADAIGNIQNPTEKAYAAMAIFGKGGAELLQGLDGHLAESMKHFEDLGLVIDEKTVKAADDFGDQLGLMGKQLTAILAGCLAPMLPALSALGTALMWVAEILGKTVGFAAKGVSEVLMGLWAVLAEGLAWMADMAQRIPIVGKHMGFLAGAADWLHDSSKKTQEQLAKLALGGDAAGEAAKKAAPALIGLGGVNAEAEAAAKKFAEALADVVSGGDSLQGTIDRLDGAVVEAVKSYLAAGRSQANLAIVYGLTDTQINAIVKTYEKEKEALKTLDDFKKQGNAFNLKEIERIAGEQEVAAARQEAADRTRFQAALETTVDFQNKINDAGLRGTDLHIAQINHERDAHLSAIVAVGPAYDQARNTINAYYDYQARRAGDVVGALREDYEILAASNTATVDEIRAAWDAWYDKWEAQSHQGLVVFAKSLSAIVGSLQQLAQIAGGTFGGIVQGLATVVASTNTMITGYKEAAKAQAHMADTGKKSAADVAAAAGGYIAMAAAAIQAIKGLFSMFESGHSKVMKAIKEQQDAIDELSSKAAQYGISMTSVFSARNLDAFNAALKQTKEQVGLIDQAVQKYNVTWKNFDGDKRMQMFDEQVRLVNVDVGRLESIGLSHDAAVRATASAYVQLGIDAVATLGEIPDSIAPVLLELAKMGAITEENARQLLGLKDEAVLDWQAMEDAAKKYGIQVEALGTKYQAAKVGEVGKGLLKDWNLLIDGGADVNAVIAGMGTNVQDFIAKAIALGLDVPADMKPMLQAFIDHGALVDATGKKLTDLSQLKFAAPVESEVDKLIRKLGELVDAINRAGSGLSGLSVPSNVVQFPNGNGIDYGGAQAEGGFGMVSRPTLFLAGEAGPEQVAFSGANRSFAAAGADMSGVEARLDRLERNMGRRVGVAVRDALVLSRKVG